MYSVWVIGGETGCVGGGEKVWVDWEGCVRGK